jgi:DNA-directed RNA polymerase subunit N (RpoN/RPB10)
MAGPKSGGTRRCGQGNASGDRATACLPEGMPAMMGATFPLEILQSKGQVTIIEEAFTQVRRILLDQPQKPIADVEPGFYGHSVGKWEGNVLVVDTVGVARMCCSRMRRIRQTCASRNEFLSAQWNPAQ